ncbi:MAG: hypothetical protein RLP15_13760 [Cryomorphaceae bacterium]
MVEFYDGSPFLITPSLDDGVNDYFGLGIDLTFGLPSKLVYTSGFSLCAASYLGIQNPRVLERYQLNFNNSIARQFDFTSDFQIYLALGLSFRLGEEAIVLPVSQWFEINTENLLMADVGASCSISIEKGVSNNFRVYVGASSVYYALRFSRYDLKEEKIGSGTSKLNSELRVGFRYFFK